MSKLPILILLFSSLVQVCAGNFTSKVFKRASIPEIIEQIKFLNLNISRMDDLDIEWVDLAFNLEQTPILPNKYHSLLKHLRDYATHNLQTSSMFRSKLLKTLNRHIRGRLPSNSKFMIKFSEENVLENFMERFPRVRRLHPKLLWVVFSSIPEGQQINTFSGSFTHIEKDSDIFIEPVVEDGAEQLPPELWGVDRIGTKVAWQNGFTGGGVTVAVVDSGVNHNHSAIRDRMWINSLELNGKTGLDDDGNGYVDDIYGYNFFNLTSDSMDYNGHGSHVAGTIAGWEPTIDFYGVAPQSRIMAVKTHNSRGLSSRRAVVEGILYAADNGAQVINCSWSGPPEAANWSQLLHDAIEYASQKGALVVAAAGNKGNYNDANPVYPACYQNVISVAATAYIADNIASFSNFGTRTVHVAAPGSAIYSMTHEEGYYMRASGTSMAAPHVAGAAALIIQKLQESLQRQVTSDEVKQLLMDQAIPVPGTENKVATGIISLENL